MTSNRLKGRSEVKWIALGEMHCNTRHAQRETHDKATIERMARNFDPDSLGTITLSYRDGSYYILDGYHRSQAAILWIGDGWEKQQLKCDVYTGLTERDEAKLFLDLNRSKTVSAMDKFRVSLTAGIAEYVEVNGIVSSEGLIVGRRKSDGCISAVTSLMWVYSKAGPDVLRKSIRIIRDSFGDTGFDAAVIKGIGLICQRYNGSLPEELAIEKLAKTRAGVHGLLGKAEALRKSLETNKVQAVAGAAVDIINQGRRGRRVLPSWWSTGSES